MATFASGRGGSTSSVPDYRADGVITALRQLLAGRRAKALHADAIRFAFDLFRGVPPDKQNVFASDYVEVTVVVDVSP